MAETTHISWAHSTFNIVIGCVELSEACTHCYARTLANRWGLAVWGKAQPRKQMSEHYWNDPLRWEKKAEKDGQRRRVFCSSLADVFEDHPDVEIARQRLWPLIEKTPMLDWMLLTKRHDCIARMLPKAWLEKPRDNVWLGVTAENQRRADERISALLSVPAKVHWVSAEPLLGAIDFSAYMVKSLPVTDDRKDAPDGAVVNGMERVGDSWERRAGVNWVIVGGESGTDARRMDPQWARDILEQCRRHGVAYHFKQKGEILARELGCKDKAGKDSSEWPSEFQVQEFPAKAIA